MIDDRTIGRQLQDAIQEKINKKHESNKKIEDRKKTEKRNPFDAITDSLQVQSNKKEIGKLAETLKAVGKVCDVSVSRVTVPSELKEKLEDLCADLPREARMVVVDFYGRCLRAASSSQKNDINSKAEEAIELLEKAGLSSGCIYSRSERETFTYVQVIEKVRKEKLSFLNADLQYLNPPVRTKSSIEPPEIQFLDDLRRMVSEGKIEEDRNIRDILSNMSKIKEAYVTRKEASSLELTISNTVFALNGTSVDFSLLQEQLQKMGKEYQRSVEKAEAFLGKFNFEAAKIAVEKQRKEQEQEEIKNRIIRQYASLAYDLEKAETEGKSFEEIAEIKKKMREVAESAALAGFTPDDLRAALTEGRSKYRDERSNQQALVQALTEEWEAQRELEAEMYRSLREQAIKELELTGGFEPIYEWRNGDAYDTLDREAVIRRKMQQITDREKDEEYQSSKTVVAEGDRTIADAQESLRRAAMEELEFDSNYRYLTADEKEAAIQKKMREYAMYANMKPEERGLAISKEHGYIPQDKTLADLTPTQINDLRYAYRETEETREIKRLQALISSEKKYQANTIYKQYIRYLASQDDKASALKFSEYAKLLYGQMDMEESMVDEETKGKSI